MLLLFLQASSIFSGPIRMLEIAPKACFKNFCKSHRTMQYVGIDLASPLADVLSDVTSLGLADESFDVVVCFHVLEHVKDDRSALEELRRVLRPGGVAIIQVPLQRLNTFEIEADTSAHRELFGQDDHVRSYGWDIVERLRDAGLDARLEQPLDRLPKQLITRFALAGHDRDLVIGTRQGDVLTLL